MEDLATLSLFSPVLTLTKPGRVRADLWGRVHPFGTTRTTSPRVNPAVAAV
jgi:hypothetical protein